MVIYDLKPQVLEAVGDGSFMYRWSITETEQGWSCDEVVVWATVTRDKITEAVISHIWPSTYEQKLLNDYNASQLGIFTGDDATTKINTYKQFLQDRASVKEQIYADCSYFNIL